MLQSISVEVKRALSSNKMSSPQAAEIRGDPLRAGWLIMENPMEILWKSYGNIGNPIENPMEIVEILWKSYGNMNMDNI